MTDNFIVVLGLLLGIIIIVLLARLIQNRSQKTKTQELAYLQQEKALDPNLVEIRSKMMTETKLRRGADWFFWIAGLSILNSIFSITGGGLNFIIGLGLPQLIGAIANFVAEETSTTAGIVVVVIGFISSAIFAGIFVVFGFYARKGKKWAFIIGMILYGLDGLIFIWVGDYLSVGFHLFALFGLYGGLKAIQEIAAEEHTSGEGQDSLVTNS